MHLGTIQRCRWYGVLTCQISVSRKERYCAGILILQEWRGSGIVWIAQNPKLGVKVKSKYNLPCHQATKAGSYGHMESIGNNLRRWLINPAGIDDFMRYVDVEKLKSKSEAL